MSLILFLLLLIKQVILFSPFKIRKIFSYFIEIKIGKNSEESFSPKWHFCPFEVNPPLLPLSNPSPKIPHHFPNFSDLNCWPFLPPFLVAGEQSLFSRSCTCFPRRASPCLSASSRTSFFFRRLTSSPCRTIARHHHRETPAAHPPGSHSTTACSKLHFSLSQADINSSSLVLFHAACRQQQHNNFFPRAGQRKTAAPAHEDSLAASFSGLILLGRRAGAPLPFLPRVFFCWIESGRQQHSKQQSKNHPSRFGLLPATCWRFHPQAGLGFFDTTSLSVRAGVPQVSSLLKVFFDPGAAKMVERRCSASTASPTSSPGTARRWRCSYFSDIDFFRYFLDDPFPI
jgi:hypothetical protein